MLVSLPSSTISTMFFLLPKHTECEQFIVFDIHNYCGFKKIIFFGFLFLVFNSLRRLGGAYMCNMSVCVCVSFKYLCDVCVCVCLRQPTKHSVCGTIKSMYILI